MANQTLKQKADKILRQGYVDHFDAKVRERVTPRENKAPRKPRRKLDPAERSWAHVYLRFIAYRRGLPYDGARESMQILARVHDMEVPEATGSAKRSGPVIELAKAIQAKTGIVMTVAERAECEALASARAPIGGSSCR
jgi:hypothetical protein